MTCNIKLKSCLWRVLSGPLVVSQWRDADCVKGRLWKLRQRCKEQEVAWCCQSKALSIVLDDVMCFLKFEVIFTTESRGAEEERKGFWSGFFPLLLFENFLRTKGEISPWWLCLFKWALCPYCLCPNLPTHQNHLGEYLKKNLESRPCPGLSSQPLNLELTHSQSESYLMGILTFRITGLCSPS